MMDKRSMRCCSFLVAFALACGAVGLLSLQAEATESFRGTRWESGIRGQALSPARSTPQAPSRRLDDYMTKQQLIQELTAELKKIQSGDGNDIAQLYVIAKLVLPQPRRDGSDNAPFNEDFMHKRDLMLTALNNSAEFARKVIKNLEEYKGSFDNVWRVVGEQTIERFPDLKDALISSGYEVRDEYIKAIKTRLNDPTGLSDVEDGVTGMSEATEFVEEMGKMIVKEREEAEGTDDVWKALTRNLEAREVLNAMRDLKETAGASIDPKKPWYFSEIRPEIFKFNADIKWMHKEIANDNYDYVGPLIRPAKELQRFFQAVQKAFLLARRRIFLNKMFPMDSSNAKRSPLKENGNAKALKKAFVTVFRDSANWNTVQANPTGLIKALLDNNEVDDSLWISDPGSEAMAVDGDGQVKDIVLYQKKGTNEVYLNQDLLVELVRGYKAT